MLRIVWFLFLLFASWRLCSGDAAAQSQAEQERMERQLKAASPKLVQVCFDVSGSMENLGVFAPLRETLIPLLREGLKAGDQCVIAAFDPEPRVLFDRRLQSDGDIDAAIDALPGDVTPNRMGTNIRWPHHQALKRAEERHPPATFILLVSDSYNDTPANDDRARPDYLKYYTLGPGGVAQLKVYPKTAENRDYERLLRRQAALNVTTWGIGVEIDLATGRPIERLPRTPESRPEPVSATGPATAPPPRSGPFPWLWLLVAAAAAAAIAAWVSVNRPVRVSLAEGPRRHQNFSLRPRESIVVGGSGAKGYELGYPIPGPIQPCAYVARGLRDFSLRPGEAAAAGEATLFVNNEEINAPRRIEYSDDIKVRVNRPGPEQAPAEYRLQFGRAIETDET